MTASVGSIHPLDPLGSSELAAAVAQAKVAWKLDHRHLFAMVQLDEPTKTELTNLQPNSPVVRRARMMVWDKSRGVVCEGVLVLGGATGALVEIAGAKAPVLSSESEQAIAAVRTDTRIIEALLQRGINDVHTVHMETWPIGAQMPKYLDIGRRVIWTPMWHCPTPQANFYAHPIGGLHAIVDLDTGEVVDVENDQQIPIPQTPGPYRESQTGANIGLKELAITQPDGASFTVNGWRIDWERWNMRIGFCQREGLVIHEVQFDDNGGDCLLPSSSFHTAIQVRVRIVRMHLILASLVWATTPTRSLLVATVWARLCIWTPQSPNQTDQFVRFQMPSACTKKTWAFCGNTLT
jgi:primary-amine oxidase